MKKKLSIILCIAAVLALAVFVAIKVYLVYHPGEPKVISDLCYGKKGCKDFLVYVKENGIYTPYIVIDTKNYGEDAVLLLRKDVYMQEMMYRDEDLQGIGAAYYPGSIVDNFLENEFFGLFSEGMKDVIRNSPVRVHTIMLVSKRRGDNVPYLETIYRHVFVLSFAELDGPAIRDKDEDEGDVIPEALANPVLLYTWLRSEANGGDDVQATLWINTGFINEHVQYAAEHYVRPVMTVNRNEPIVLQSLESGGGNGMGYVFPSDR